MRDTRRSSSVHVKKDVLCYEVLSPDDAVQTASCMSHALAVSEPLSRTMRIDPAIVAPLADVLCRRAAEGRLSIIAKDLSGRIVGFSLSEDFSEDPPMAVGPVHVKLRPVLAMLRSLECEYMRSRRTIPGQLLYIVAMGLDPRYARAGIATTLVRRNLDLARHSGFEIGRAHV